MKRIELKLNIGKNNRTIDLTMESDNSKIAKVIGIGTGKRYKLNHATVFEVGIVGTNIRIPNTEDKYKLNHATTVFEAEGILEEIAEREYGDKNYSIIKEVYRNK